MEPTSPRIDRSVANQQVDKVENKSFESTTMHSSALVPSISSMALTKTFPSSIAYPAARISADVTALTGRRDL